MIRRVAAMLAVGGALAGFAVSLFVPHRYQATARFTFAEPYSANARRLFEEASEATLHVGAIEQMIRQSPNFKDLLYLETVGEATAEVRANLTLKLSGTGGAIRFEDDNAETAIEVVRLVLNDFGNNAARLAGARRAQDVIRVFQTPQARLTGLTPWLLTGFGLLAGLLVSLLVWLLLPRHSRAAVQGNLH